MNLRKEPKILGFRNKERYKIHDRMENIIVGKGELVWIETKQGWITPTGEIIQDKEKATQYAEYLNQRYIKAYQHKKQTLSKQRHLLYNKNSIRHIH